jgi:AcrR family transcriptional regulator
MAARQTGSRPRTSSRNKREEILQVATQQFGRDGFEYSKWADVAAAVGVGSTALYHYFESKLHALYSLMAEALEAQREEFAALTKGSDDYLASLVAVLRAGYDLTEQQVLRNRVLIAEQVLIGIHRTSPREEEARQQARAATRDLEFDWANFLSRGMAQGVIPEADPRMLTRAVLGLHNSVWHWYRPDGNISLQELSDFYVDRCLRVLGVAHDSTGD